MQGICDMVSFCFEPSPDPDSDLDFDPDPAPDLALAPVLDYFLYMNTILLVIPLPWLLMWCFKDLSSIVPLEFCSFSWNKQLSAIKNLKLCIAKSLLNKIWKDHVPNVFTQDVRLCPSCSPSSTPAFRWEMMSDIVHFLSINFQSCGNETFLCGDIEVNTYFDIQFDVTYEKILPWWVSKLRNVGKIPQQLSHIL